MVAVPTKGHLAIMIVCSCNVLTDHDVRSTLADDKDNKPRTAGQVYGCLGCSAQCGRCARTIRRIMDEALLGAGAAVTAQDAVVACPSACKCCPAKHPHDG